VKGSHTEERLRRQRNSLLHRVSELYKHRTYLFSIICKQNLNLSWISNKNSDGVETKGYFIAGINTPGDPYTYYCKEEHRDWFEGVAKVDAAPVESKVFERVGNVVEFDKEKEK